MIPPIHSVVSNLRPHFLKAAILAFAAAPVALTGGCSFMSKPTAKGTLNQTIPHATGGPITVDTRNGSVQIVADGSRSEVQVVASIVCEGDTQQQADDRLAQMKLDVARDTSRLLAVKPVFPGGPRGSDGASFVIRIPDASGVNVVTSNGQVTVAGLQGALKVETSNGSVTASDHNGPADIHSSNGSITVKNLAGDLVAVTSNSSVTASGVKGKADIDTSNGSITLTLDPASPGPIKLDTSNASIVVAVGSGFLGTVHIKTSNGKVTAGGAAADVVRTSNKDATIFLGDGAESTVRSSNGNITFDAKK
jgi:hypothetical protein